MDYELSCTKQSGLDCIVKYISVFLEKQYELLLSVPSNVPDSPSSGTSRQCALPNIILCSCGFIAHKRVVVRVNQKGGFCTACV